MYEKATAIAVAFVMSPANVDPRNCGLAASCVHSHSVLVRTCRPDVWLGVVHIIGVLIESPMRRLLFAYALCMPWSYRITSLY
jgi:hypothetical protein